MKLAIILLYKLMFTFLLYGTNSVDPTPFFFFFGSKRAHPLLPLSPLLAPKEKSDVSLVFVLGLGGEDSTVKDAFDAVDMDKSGMFFVIWLVTPQKKNQTEKLLMGGLRFSEVFHDIL